MQRRYWIYGVVGCLLSFTVFGTNSLVLFFGATGLFFAGALIRLVQYGYEKVQEIETNQQRSGSRQVPGLKIVSNKKLEDIDCDLKFTESQQIDVCLNEILNYTIRDYVDCWYYQFTNDVVFSKSVKKVACLTISKLAARLRQIDWVPFLTRDIVDDFASHIRLYRRAKEKCHREYNLNQLKRSNSNASSLDKDDPSRNSTSNRMDRDLEIYFFDYELEMEKHYCRDSVSTSPSYENAYLHDVSNILLFLLMPAAEFNCRPSFLLIREIVVKNFLLPVIDLTSDPDFIYDAIVWLLSDVPLSSENLLAVLEKCRDVEELTATREAVEEEIKVQRSKDTGGKDDAAVKQQLSSLLYVHRLIHSAIKRLKGGALSEQENVLFHDTIAPPQDLHFFDLSLDFILGNSIAVNYFMDFLSKNNGDTCIGLYLNLSSFNAAVSQHESAAGRKGCQTEDGMFLSNMRETALNICELYLSEQIFDKVKLDHDLVQRTLNSINSSENIFLWFDELQTAVFNVLLNDARFYPAFKRSETYLKLLTEIRFSSPHCENEKYFDGEVDGTFLAEDALDSISLRSADSNGGGLTDIEALGLKSNNDDPHAEYTAAIDTVALGNEGFALYNITANRHNDKGDITATWNVVRRYSDFYALHNLIQQKFPALRILSFPGKKAFNNLSRDLWERRKKSLNNYLKILLLPSTFQQNRGLEVALMDFLCSKDYLSDKSTIANRISNFVVNPIKVGVKSFGNVVISMPEIVVDNVVKVGDNLGKVTKSVLGVVSSEPYIGGDDSDVFAVEGRVGAQLDAAESSSNIPIRILLLCMDEIFGLRKRNQWFRRRLVAFLHHFIHAAFGSSINRKIIDYVYWLTSEQQVAEYLKAFKNTFWPNGVLAETSQQKSKSLRMKTRIVAKCKMLAVVPDELQLFMGSDTALDGVTLVFEALKNPRLNRRLCYVLIEHLLVTIFPNNKFDEILPRLHSKSPRCNEHSMVNR